MVHLSARHYNSSLSIWLSVDPMAAKYPSLSPYAYCANNPVKLVDPNGREVIIGIEGNSQADKDAAFKHLQKGTNLELSMADNGVVSIVGGNVLNDNDQQLYDAIISTSVTARIDVGGSKEFEEVQYTSGHYMGTSYDPERNTAVSTNGINLIGLQKYEKQGAEGAGIIHEITEGFHMGELAINEKTSIPKASWHFEEYTGSGGATIKMRVYDDPTTNRLFPIGHRSATPDPSDLSPNKSAHYKSWQSKKYPLH